MTRFYGFLLYFLLGEVDFSQGAKNVLMIIADDLRPVIKAYGDKNAYTPNIDKLAEESFVFHKAFAQQALCAPSRNSFLTSRRPDTLHLYDFYNYWRTFSGNYTTLPQYFKNNGYDTKSIGKIFHPGISSNFTDDYPQSWSHKPWHPSTEIYKDSPICYTKHGWHSNIVCPVRLKEQPEETLPDIQSLEEAVNYLKTRNSSDQPFFLAVGFHKPHIPLTFPREFLKFHPIDKIELPTFRSYPPGLPEVAWNPWTDLRRRYDIGNLNLSFPFQIMPDEWTRLIRQAYFASVSYIDNLIGKLLKSLEKSSLHQDTIVVLLGDHGWSLGEHGEWSKYSNFDVAVRVPLIFRVPNLTFGKNTGMHSKELVELVDLFPTLVDLAGLEKIPKCPLKSENIELCTEGDSLLPLIINEAKNTSNKINWKSSVFSQYPRPGEIPSSTPNSDKPKLKDIEIMGYSIRTKQYRYTEWVGWNSKTFKANWTDVKDIELYDHFIDPDENLNLSGRPGLEEVQTDLRKQLRKGFK